MYKKVRNNWVKHFDFMLIDWCCIQLSFIVSYMIRHGISFPYANRTYLNIAILITALHICIVFFTEPYSGILKRGYLKEFKASIKYSTVLLAALIAIIFMMKLSEAYSRVIFCWFWVLSSVFTYTMRILYKYILSKRVKDESKLRCMYLITDKKAVNGIIEKMLDYKYSNFWLKGIIILDEDLTNKMIYGIPVVASAGTMLKYVQNSVVDDVFVALRDDYPGRKELIEYCLEMGITVHINMRHFSLNIPNPQIEKVNGFTVVTTSIKTMTFRQIVLKRAIDIAGSLVGLGLMGIVFVFVAPIIYIQSPGPIFFSQERVGKNGRRFKIFKFRSMYLDAEERKKELMQHNKMKGFMFKMDNDPRITPIGRFIRKTSIDELPQFFNILKGDMSLVGTRPPTVDEYRQYALHHKKRLAIKPGLTGIWQVSGRSEITDFETVVELDAKYIQEWTLGLDLKILLKTVKVVFGGEGSV